MQVAATGAFRIDHRRSPTIGFLGSGRGAFQNIDSLFMAARVSLVCVTGWVTRSL